MRLKNRERYEQRVVEVIEKIHDDFTKDLELNNSIVPMLVRTERARKIADILTEATVKSMEQVAMQFKFKHETKGLDKSVMKMIVNPLVRKIEESIDNVIDKNEKLPVDKIIKKLKKSYFTKPKALMVAVTEVTRASVFGSEAAFEQGVILGKIVHVKDAGKVQKKTKAVKVMKVWRNDHDTICNMCGPFEGKSEIFFNRLLPPLHPYCRCWIDYVIVGM